MIGDTIALCRLARNDRTGRSIQFTAKVAVLIVGSPAIVTEIGPVVAPAGTDTLIAVALSLVGVAKEFCPPFAASTGSMLAASK